MLYYSKGSPETRFSELDLKDALESVFKQLGPKKKILILPPDITRYHSGAGIITGLIFQHCGSAVTDIMPALGTHASMSGGEIRRMFGNTPVSLFREHNWREDLVTLGEIPGKEVEALSEGRVHFPFPAQVNRLLVEGGYDLILSIGQVVPHEVAGMANYTKNIFVGVGGQEAIHRSHFLGAVYGMERIMGRADTPVRRVLDASLERFARELPIVFIQTVAGSDGDGTPTLRGLYIGDDRRCYEEACDLALKVNFTMVEEPLKRVVVYLDPREYKSTWLGNKSIYRTRMALADGGELVVIAPGVETFGEDGKLDGLIRKYGYCGTPRILELVERNRDLRENLSAAAHLIHGSSEGRFSITYCSDRLSKGEIEGVGYRYRDLEAAKTLFNPENLKDGWNRDRNGDPFYFISNPALGLWANRDRFYSSSGF